MKQPNYSYTIQGRSMPAQAIKSSAKTKSWAIDSMEALEGLSNSYTLNGRLSKQEKQVNYNLLNNIFDPTDFNYVYDQFNLGLDHEKLPARFRNINLINDKYRSLIGEELETPFDWTAIGVAGEVINSIEEKQQELLAMTMASIVRRELGLEPTTDENGKTIPPQDPERVIKQFQKTYKDNREINTNTLLKIFWEHLNLKEKFNTGYGHALATSEEVYYVGSIGGKPDVRTVRPVNFEFDRNPETSRIEECSWAREERWLSAGQIIDEFGEYLTDAEVKRIDNGDISNSPTGSYFYPHFGYTNVDLKVTIKQGNYSEQTANNSSYIRVATFAWKSMKQIGFLRQVTPDGDIEEIIVDDTFKLTEEQKLAGVTVEWRWISVVMQGHKIGSDIFTNIEELPYQHRTLDNPSECKLPYVGRIYDGLNAKATSFVDMLKPHQYLYNIIWYRLEDELAKAKGKAVIMDLAQLPKSEGMDITEWIHYLNNAGIMFINSFEEGKGINAGKTAAFNQFTEIDRAASAVIGQYIGILDKIEKLVDRISGISPQRQGATSPSETATGVENSIRNSNTITASYFYQHDLTKKQVLEQLIGVARVLYADGKKGRYFVDESFPIMMDIDGADLNDSDYAIYITNGAAHKEKLANVERGAQMALQASTIKLKDYVSILNSTSFAEKLNMLENAEAQEQERLLQVEEQRNQAIQMAEKERTAREEMVQNREDARKRLDIEGRIAVAQIQALGYAKDKDFDKNNVADVLEVDRVNIDREKLNLERRKQDDVRSIEEKKLLLEKQKIDTQLKIAKTNKNQYDK